MNRLASRVAQLEHGAPDRWRTRCRVPMRSWPDHVLLALVAEGEGWPAGYVPTEGELRVAIGDGDQDADGAP